MAYRRHLTIKAKFFANQRFTPSISHFNHDPDRKNQNLEEKSNLFHQTRSYGVYGINSSSAVRFRDPKWYQMTASGFLLARKMSTSIGDNNGFGDKIEFINDNDIANVLVDETMEIVSNVSNETVSVVSEVAVAAADSSFPVAALQYAIDGVHTFTGCNWWASIAITTLIIRTLTIPLMINQQKATAKLTIMRPELDEIRKKMEAEDMSPDAVAKGQEQMNMVFKKHGVSMFTPFKMLFIQLPIFISFFLAIENMTAKVPSFKTGGTSWFVDLTTADSFYILPMLNALSFWLLVEFNMQEGLDAKTAFIMKNVARVFVVLSIPLMAYFPKGIFCYWITSNMFSFVYGLILKQDNVKKLFNIPIIVPPPPSPDSQSKPKLSFLEELKKFVHELDSKKPKDPADPKQ